MRISWIFLLLSSIYLAPRVSDLVANLAGGIYLLISAICFGFEIYQSRKSKIYTRLVIKKTSIFKKGNAIG